MIALLACNSEQKVRNLSASEQAAMDSAGIDGGVTARLRTYVPEAFYLQTPEADVINARQGFPIAEHRARGVAFKVRPDLTRTRIAALAERIWPEGYAVYRSRIGNGGEPDELCVLMTQQLDASILRYEQTDGINYSITTDSLIRILEDLDVQLTITGASHDWMEARIEQDVPDWNALAAKVYAHCPDVVDQGTGTVQALAEEMRRTKTLFLWWD
ncbi:MAG TPA: DUF4253 domain-containing protein [Flavobacteriales bacterium]|nr:DUF4253 domain-containing protein [Flavobacteriales bacterium]